MSRKPISLFLSLLMIAGIGTALILEATVISAVGLGAGVCAVDQIVGDGCIGSFEETELSDGTIEQIHNSIYSNAVFMDDYSENMKTETTSYANQSYGVSMAGAKLVGIESHNDGLERSEAHDEINQEVSDFYATYERSVWEDRNRQSLQIDRMAQRIDESDGLDYSDVFDSVADVWTEENTIELVNGTEMPIYEVHVTRIGSTNYDQVVWDDDLDTTRNLRVMSPNEEDEVVLNNEGFRDSWKAIETHRQRANDNVIGVVNEIYDNYDSGEIDVSDVMSPVELLQTGATNYEDTGHYSYKCLSLEFMGLSGDKSNTFEVTYQNSDMDEEKTRFGCLFKGSDGELETGVEYDATEDTYVFIQDNEDGSASRIDLDDTFTIESMIDGETGEEINETTTQTTDFMTESTEDLAEQVEELNELQDDITEILDVIGGVQSWFDSFTDFSNWSATQVLTLVVGLYVGVRLVIATLKGVFHVKTGGMFNK